MKSIVGNNSFQAKDYWNLYIKKRGKSKNKISYNLYYKIFSDIFDGFFDVLLKEGHVKLPHSVGDLFVRCIKTKPKIIDGKFVYVAPVDWHSTKKLWAEDENAKIEKKIIKYPPGDVYQIKYIPDDALCYNMRYYNFRLLRSVQRNKLKNAAKSGKLQGLSYYKCIKKEE